MKILFYKEYTVNFLSVLSKKEQAKINRAIALLGEYDFSLTRKYAKHIKGKLWELRVGLGNSKFRIFYFIYNDKYIVLLNGFTKKTMKTPLKEITKAVKLMNEALKELE